MLHLAPPSDAPRIVCSSIIFSNLENSFSSLKLVWSIQCIYRTFSLLRNFSLATKLQAAVAAVVEGATCVLGLGLPAISAYSEKLLWQSAKTKWRLTKSWLFTPTHTLLSPKWSWRECIFIKSILINMHAPPWEAHESMGALLITPRWGRPRNFRLGSFTEN